MNGGAITVGLGGAEKISKARQRNWIVEVTTPLT
jgi:hypothetical protein